MPVLSHAPDAAQEEQPMTAVDERQDQNRLAEQSGWQRRDLDRVDVYARGTTRIRVIWRGSSAISGASLYHDDVLTSYTRDLPTVNGWLQR
jgi:hypothetical protein